MFSGFIPSVAGFGASCKGGLSCPPHLGTEMRMCVKPVSWPPRKPKIKSYFTTLSLDCFIR